MNYDMFSSKQNDEMDPNYIYPRPYIDPMMYINPYGMGGNFYPNMQMDPNMMAGNYMTYMNPYMTNMFMGNVPNEIDDFDQDFDDDDMYIQPNMQQMQNMMPPGMPGMPNMQGMFPNGMMMPPGMMPFMMMPGMMPGMFPYMMMPGMSPINMEEFDEEEM